MIRNSTGSIRLLVITSYSIHYTKLYEDEFFASGKLPDNKGDCDTPLAATHALGEKLRVSATPTLVFADGSIIPGALPRDRLEAELAKAATGAKKTAAAPN